MFVYTTTSHPAYSSAALYPLSHYVVSPSIPTARERYLRAVAEAQYARVRYLSELEEQRILASQQREALRQAAFRQRQMLAAQDNIACRRGGHIHVGNVCRPVASLQGRRQAFARRHRENLFSYEPQDLSSNLEATILALLPDGRDEECMTERDNEKACAEEARKEDVLNARVRFVRMLQRALDATHADHDIQSSQPVKPSNNVPLSSQTRIPRQSLTHERAARTIQQRWRSHSADVLARKDAIATIATLRARFQFLKDTFSFPEQLEFKEHVAGQEQGVPTLLFTPANAAVHAFSHELTKLLTLADAVPSHGSRGIREQRRSFVRLVEEALDGIDRRVAEVWGNKAKGFAAMTLGKDGLETSSAVSPDEVQPASETVVHFAEPDLSVPRIASTTADSKPQGLSSTKASTIIPSPATTDVDISILEKKNIQSSEVLAQDLVSQYVPSESEVRKRLPTPEETSNSQPDIVTIGSTREDHDVVARTQPNVDTIQRDFDASNTASPSSTLSQLRPSETSQVSSVGDREVTGVDIIPISEGDDDDLTSGSPVSGLTTAQSFDVVYPDSLSSSPPVVESVAEPTTGHSVSIEGSAIAISRVGNEAQNSLEQENEEEAFELL